MDSLANLPGSVLKDLQHPKDIEDNHNDDDDDDDSKWPQAKTVIRFVLDENICLKKILMV